MKFTIVLLLSTFALANSFAVSETYVNLNGGDSIRFDNCNGGKKAIHINGEMILNCSRMGQDYFVRNRLVQNARALDKLLKVDIINNEVQLSLAEKPNDSLVLCEQKVSLYETILSAQSTNRDDGSINEAISGFLSTYREASSVSPQ